MAKMADRKRKTLKDLAREECSLVGFWGMTPAQQGGEHDPLTRRVVDPREGSLNPPQRTVGAPPGRFPSRFGLPPRVRQHLLH
jgi:hypothetical protein